MAVSCEAAKTWLVILGVYSGLLTGALLGLLLLKFLRRKVKTITHRNGNLGLMRLSLSENHS